MFKINPEDKILVIGSHPESIIIGCGGLTGKYVNQTDLLCAIPYNMAQFHIEELRQSFSVIFQTVDFNKVFIGQNPENLDEAAYYEDYLSNIDLKNYDIIIAPNKEDNKPENKFAGNDFLKKLLEKQGYKDSLKILRYEVWNPLKNADYYEDITDCIEQKRNLVLKYRNNNSYAEQIINMNLFRAFTSPYNEPGKYVEAFCIDDLYDFLQIADIVNEETEKDFVSEQTEEFFKGKNLQKIIDDFADKNQGKNIVLFGAGDYTRYIFKNCNLTKLNITAISGRRFEQNRHHEFYGLKCLKPEELRNEDYDLIVISDNNFIQLYNLVLKILEGSKNASKEVVPLIKKEFDIAADKVCSRPFHTLSIVPSGHCITCCPAYINNYTIGNPAQHDIKNVWNSHRANTLRNLLINNDYSICDLNTCIQMELTDKKEIEKYFEDGTNIVKMPDTIYMGWDYDCNVACITCRSQLIKNNPATLERLKSIESGVLEACKTAKLFYTSGNGDPFGSSYARELIKKVVEINPDIKFFIHTNGVLCTEKIAEELNIKDKIIKVIFSIHSACKETYDKIVKYGNYEKVMQNAEWISKLKKAGQIETFIMAFVVEKLNYKDMPDFVRIAEKYDALASFRYYRQWANNTEYRYEDMAVFEEWHQEHSQFLSVLKDNIFDSPHCTFDARLQSLRNKAKNM